MMNTNTPKGEEKTKSVNSGNQNKEKTISGKELNYICSMCDRSFNLRRNWLRHVENVHEKSGKVYFCPNCPKYFSYKQVRDRHIEKKACRPYPAGWSAIDRVVKKPILKKNKSGRVSFQGVISLWTFSHIRICSR